MGCTVTRSENAENNTREMASTEYLKNSAADGESRVGKNSNRQPDTRRRELTIAHRTIAASTNNFSWLMSSSPGQAPIDSVTGTES